MERLTSLIIMDTDHIHKIYGPDQVRLIQSITKLLHPPMNKEEAFKRPALLKEVQILFSGWDGFLMDKEFLKKVPELKIVFYGAGTIREIVTQEFWTSGITITSSYAANAVPVAEFTFGQIIFSLKKVQYFNRLCFENKSWEKDKAFEEIIPGCYRRKVGLVSLGMIGQKVLDFLQMIDVDILVYDIIENNSLSRNKVFEYACLSRIFQECDVISLHTADLPSTRKMIGYDLLSSMKPEASIINTARGTIIDEAALIRILNERQDIRAYLDVMEREPPDEENALLSLPNVFITPHIAGSQQDECRRMGQLAVEECQRYLKGEDLHWEIRESMMKTLA